VIGHGCGESSLSFYFNYLVSVITHLKLDLLFVSITFISPFIPTLFACSILTLFRDEPGDILF